MTVFASDPSLVDKPAGLRRDQPLDLTGTRDDVDMRVQLNLPAGDLGGGDRP